MSLFSKAEENAKTTKTKTPAKVVVKVAGKEFDNQMIEYIQLKAQASLIKTRLEILESEFKPDCIDVFNSEYKKNGVRPDSFLLTSDSGSNALLVAKDQYLLLDENSAPELVEEFGSDVIEKIKTFELDTELVNKHGDVISKAIEKIKEIPQEEKDRLIKATIKVVVKKGSIDKALTVGKGNIANFISKIRPIFAITPKGLGADVKTEWVFVNQKK